MVVLFDSRHQFDGAVEGEYKWEKGVGGDQDGGAGQGLKWRSVSQAAGEGEEVWSWKGSKIFSIV